MIFAFIHSGHVQPGSFADRHIFLTILIMAAGMSLPLIAVLILVQILKWKGIIKPPEPSTQPDHDSEKEKERKREKDG